MVVGERIRALKTERRQAESGLAEVESENRRHGTIDLDEATAVLESLPDLSKPLAAADPQLRRQVYDAFRLGIEIDRNQPQIRVKALVSSAFAEAGDLEDLAVTDKAIAGAGFEPATFGL